MDNILKLIKEEVKWVKLGEVCTILDSKRKPISKTKRIEGIYPYYGANGIQDYVNGYIFDGTYILMGEDGSVIKKDNTPVLHWVKNSKIWVNNHAHILEEKEEKYNLRYIYYYLSTVDVSSIVRGTPPKITQANMKDIEIPIPSLELQEKIVKILDKYTDAYTKLQVALKNEIELRTKQYNYYKDMLLSQDYLLKKAKKLCGQDASLEWMKIGDVLGYEQPNKYIVDNTEYKNEYKTPVLTAGQTFILGYTNEENGIFQASKENPVIIFDDFTTSNHWVDFNFKVKSSAMKFLRLKTDEVLFRYCYYYMQIIKIDTTEHKRMWISKYSNIQIPIPPLQVQTHISSILDKYTSSYLQLQTTLSKEIELRTKQYEYYREKLLDFKK